MPPVVRVLLAVALGAGVVGCGDDGPPAPVLRRGSAEEFCSDFNEVAPTLNFAPETGADFGRVREGLLGLRYPDELVDAAGQAIPGMSRLAEELDGVDLTTPEGAGTLAALAEQPAFVEAFAGSASIKFFALTTCEAPSP